jgi:hypothetical protein
MMATAISYPALPSGLGATVIQANALTVPANEYKLIDWHAAQNWVSKHGRGLFQNFPGGKDAHPNWTFYLRSDLTGSTSSQKSLVGIQVTQKRFQRSALNTTYMSTDSFPAEAYEVKVNIWHYATITLTNGSSYPEVLWSGAGTTVPSDPETIDFLTLATTYELVYEALAFLFKQNAAAAPTYEPMMAAIAGLSPLD